MSIGMNLAAEQKVSASDTGNVKTKTNRRHGACNPCKESKTKCDGGTPCGACRAEKRKSRPCEYTKKARDIAAAREESSLRRQRDSHSSSSDEYFSKEEPIISGGSPAIGPASGPSSNPSASMHRNVSLRAIVEEFIQVKPGSRAREIQNIRRVEEEWLKFQTFLAGPFSSNYSTTGQVRSQLEHWKTELRRILEQMNRGDLLGAWSSIAALLRSFSSWETFAPLMGVGVVEGEERSALQNFYQQKNAIYTQVVELDCALGFFLGDQSLEHVFDRSRSSTTADVDGHSVDTMELFTTIRQVLKIDMISEAGVWEFVRLEQHHETGQPSTPLQKMALCIYDADPAERQAVKLTACLVFAVMHCRIASVGMHYSQAGIMIPRIEDGSTDIIRELRLDQSRTIAGECTQVNKYAGHALAAFGRLCEIDAENTAKSWIRLHSALIAAVLFGIHGLRERDTSKDKWDSYEASLAKIKKQFQDLKSLNPDCPLFDHAIRILRSCEKRDLKVKRGGKKNVKVVVEEEDIASSSWEDSDHELQSQPIPTEMAATRGQKRDIASASESSLPRKAKRRKTITATRPSATIEHPTQGEPRLQQQSAPGQPHSIENPVSIYQQISTTNPGLLEAPSSFPRSEHMRQQQAQLQQSSTTVYPNPYPFHPPLNDDQEYWKHEGFALETMERQNLYSLALVPLNQQRQFFDSSTQFTPNLMHSTNVGYGIPVYNSNMAHMVPTPQYVESTNLVPHVKPPEWYIPHETDSSYLHGHTNQIARTEGEGLQQVQSSSAGAPPQSWMSMQHTSTVDPNPTPLQQSVPQPGLLRRASEGAWQVGQQYNYSGQGYPYSNPPGAQSQHASFYESRQHY